MKKKFSGMAPEAFPAYKYSYNLGDIVKNSYLLQPKKYAYDFISQACGRSTFDENHGWRTPTR